MKIISFAWTVPALLAGRKTRTRREWRDDYAERFRVGDKIQAYDKQPRFKGKKIAIIEITGIKKEKLYKMNDKDYEIEGFKYFEENNLQIWKMKPRVAFDDWRNNDEEVWVVDFKVLEILK